MANTIDKKTFVADLSAQNGTIDVDNLSLDLLKSMKDAGVVDDSGVSTAELSKIAGADGRIRGSAEMGALFDLVDSYDSAPTPKGGAASFSVERVPGLFGQPELPPSGALYEALQREVQLNRSKAWYASPRSNVAPPQERLLASSDAAVVDPQQAKPPVALGVPGISQYDYASRNGLDGDKACAPTAIAQAQEYNTAKFGARAPHLEGPDQAIQVAYAEDETGNTVVDGNQAARGREYIDRCLDQGLPVVVGVSYSHRHPEYNEGLTDHFLTVDGRGYEADGRAFYTYKDPGAAGRSGKLYVDKSQEQLFKEGDYQTHHVEDFDYELTQVRTYAEVR